MRLPIAFQALVLAGVLFAAALCLAAHKPEEFSRLENPNLYVLGIAKLEGQAPFENKEDLVAVLKALAKSEGTSITALRANAEIFEGVGYFLLFLAFVQCLGIYFSLRRRGK